MSSNKLDPNISPAHVLVDYTWALLKLNMGEVWSEAKYGGLIPIVPLAEEPEIDGYDGPHIVYGYVDDGTGVFPEENNGSLTFAVYDDSFRRLGKTLNILRTAFERQDDSAKDINKFSSAFDGVGLSTAEENDGPYIGIRFGYTDVGFLEGGTPEDTEGGRQSALLNIRYSYYVDYNVVTDVV